MSKQLEIFEQIAEHSSIHVNERDVTRGGKVGRLSVPPGLQHAKVTRPAFDSPAATVSPSEANPEPSVAPVVPRLVRTKIELVAALRARKESLNISHETLDGLVGWTDRYSSKVLAPVPRKHLSPDTLRLVLDALALGVAAVVLIEDADQAKLMRPRWTMRSPHGPRPDVGALFSDGPQDRLLPATEDSNVEISSELPPKA